MHVRKVIGHQVVAQRVALLHRCPQRIGPGEPMQPDRIARARGVGLVTAAIGIVAVDGRAHRVLAGRNVGTRADPHVELVARAIEQQAARPVPVPESLQRDYFLPRPGGHGFRVVLIALDGLRFAYVKILVPQRQSVRAIQAGDQLLAVVRLVAIGFVQRNRIDGSIRTLRGVAEQQLAAGA